jgi:hypothetical protein
MLANNFQQTLMGQFWKNTAKMMHQKQVGKNMVVVGKVIGSVLIRDLGKTIHYGASTSFNELEINKSRDLHQAIRQGWIEIIEGKDMLKRALVTPTIQTEQIQPQQQQNINKEEMMEMVKEMAKTMATEMMKSNQSVMSVAKEVAKEMVKEINSTGGIQQSIATNSSKYDENEKDDPKNIFLDVDESKFNVNINKIGIIEESNNDLSNTLEKMKRLKGGKK